jgi:hypothetical protein
MQAQDRPAPEPEARECHPGATDLSKAWSADGIAPRIDVGADVKNLGTSAVVFGYVLVGLSLYALVRFLIRKKSGHS